MTNYLGECDTVEMLAMRRNEIIAAINKEFAEKRKKLLETKGDFKRIEFIDVPMLSNPIPVNITLPFVEGQVPKHVIRVLNKYIMI